MYPDCGRGAATQMIELGKRLKPKQNSSEENIKYGIQNAKFEVQMKMYKFDLNTGSCCHILSSRHQALGGRIP